MEGVASSLLERRDQPKIGGSVAAFYVLVIILVLVTIISSTAVVFLVLDERNHGRRRFRYREANLLHHGSRPTSRDRWYHRIFGSSERYRDGEKGEPGRLADGWIPAGTKDEWETDSLESGPHKKHKSPGASIQINTLEYNSPATTRQSYITSPQRSHSLTSERSSSLIHGVRGLSYPDVYAPSPQRPIPSIQSQLYSPPSSPPSSMQHESGWVLSAVSSNPVRVSTSPAPMSVSPVSFEEYTAEIHTKPHNDRQTSSTSVPSIHTFEGGTRFIEAL